MTADNLAAVQQAIAAKNNDGTETDTLAKLQAVITAAANAYQSALNAIQAYAVNDSATPPTDAQYAAAGVTGVTPANLAAINSAIHAQGGTNGTPGANNVADADDATAVDTAAEVQAIVNSYNAILAEANGATPDADAQDPTAAQYAAIGVTGVDAGAEETLLGDVIGGKTTTDVDTVAKVQALAAPVQAVIAVAALDNTYSDGTYNNTASSSATGTVSPSGDALANISGAAQNNNATASTPSAQIYADAGVTGVNANNLAAINDALNSAAVDGNAADSTADIQAIVNSYNAILAEANDSNANAGDTVADATANDPLASDYANIGATIGLAASDAENLALLNDIVGAAQTADVNTVAEINELARIANAIQTTAAGGTPGQALTVQDLATIGLNTTGLTTNNLPALLAVIAGKADEGTQTDTLAKLQALIDNLDKVAPADPTLDLGTGVSNGATSAEAQAGVISASAEAGSTITVTFTDAQGDTVTKTVSNATGSAQAIALAAGDLGTGASKLSDGLVNVSVTATDAAGNVSNAATTSFTLDTQAPTLTMNATVVDALVPTTAASGSGTLNKFASTSALADGGYVRVWQSNKTGDFDIYGQVYNADGSVRGAQFVVNSSTTGDQGVPLVVALQGSNAGKFVVTWVNGSTTPYTTTFARVFSTSGSTVTADGAAV